jgi:imidazole glycerol-phosphate synthase subunit HisH
MIYIVDYDAGNLTSVKRALNFLGIESCISADENAIENAERIIFPGVGHAATALSVLKERGLDIALNTAFKKGTPILGICLGTQIILSHSDEGDTECLDIIKGNCVKFDLSDKTLSIPHMGWNEINITNKHFILKDVAEGDEFYFVHSYYPQPSDETNVYATCEYETVFAAALGYKNLFATQFHPEKSGKTGLQMLKNFSEWSC